MTHFDLVKIGICNPHRGSSVISSASKPLFYNYFTCIGSSEMSMGSQRTNITCNFQQQKKKEKKKIANYHVITFFKKKSINTFYNYKALQLSYVVNQHCYITLKIKHYM